MEPQKNQPTELGLLERFRKSWFPPAAVVGALAAFAAATFRSRPEPKPAPKSAEPAAGSAPAQPPKVVPQTPVALDRVYTRVAVLGGSASSHPFRLSLEGVAAGPGDSIYGLGDGEVRVFEPGGLPARSWKVPAGTACLGIGHDGRVYVGASGRVRIYDAGGGALGGFPVAGEKGPAGITAVKAFREEILVADAYARLIRRYDRNGKLLGLIGDRNKKGSFILPNGWLDFDIDARGTVYATDTGRHLVTSWALDGSPLASFGRFGMSDPADFVGCCNPVNLALAPDGSVVTGEKMVARVKVYEPEGRLLAVIGPENFDPMCIHIHLAVDSRGRILAADPVRKQISVFAPRKSGKEPR